MLGRQEVFVVQIMHSCLSEELHATESNTMIQISKSNEFCFWK